MPLSLAGDKISGTIESAGTCDFANGLFFPKVDISVEAALRGPWEAQGSIIHGSWLCKNAFGDADRWVCGEADAMH
jgi:hypothetical protein